MSGRPNPYSLKRIDINALSLKDSVFYSYNGNFYVSGDGMRQVSLPFFLGLL